MRFFQVTVMMLMLAPAATGCAEFRYDNTATTFDRPFRDQDDTLANIWLKTAYLYPARDYLTLSWAGRAWFGDAAWNVTGDGGVEDGPFFVNRDIRSMTVEQVGKGPATAPPPVGPWRLLRRKTKGLTPGFIGEDATGRSFLVKLDHPDYPELGTSVAMIGSRLTWLLGYRVPATYLVTIEGTGEAAYDGRRATASLFVPGEVVGGFKFDHYRMRREVRGYRLVAAWLNDTDRTDNNTLVAVEEGVALCYLIDFNSCLGSWNGRPKEAWRGWRYAWDVEFQLAGIATMGLLPRLPDSVEVKSPATGSFDLLEFDSALRWRPQNPNTAFDRVTQADAAWMARRIASVTEAQLKAIVGAARFSRSEDARLAMEMLLRRRERVLAAWGTDALLLQAKGG